MSKIIKVSTDLEVTVHDFPQGTIREQNRQLCELIGNGCEMIEHVMCSCWMISGHRLAANGRSKNCLTWSTNGWNMAR